MKNNILYSQLSPQMKTSKVLTGLWQVADMERDGQEIDLEQAAEALLPYLNAGLTTFDMADHYGSAELIAGILRKKAGPDQVQLLTKWVPEPGKGSKEKVRKAIQRAQERLQMEQLDLLQYHAWNYADASWLDDLFWLKELQEEGLIRHLGVTNFDTAHLNMALNCGIPLVTNQVCFSLLDQRAAAMMLDLCQKKGVKVLAFGTLAGGLLSEKFLGEKDRPADQMANWSQMKYKRFIDTAGGWSIFQEMLQILQGIAKKHEASISNIASKYILQQEGVGGVIIGARPGKSSHLKDNLQLFQFELDSADLGLIQQQLSQFIPIPGDCGDEYRKPPFLTASGDLSHHLEALPAPYEAIQVGKDRHKVLSGTIWEDLAGFSRATRKGDRILVSGTTATHGTQLIGGDDPAAQAHFVIDKIEGAIQSLGGKLEDVVRTRVYIQRMEDWEAISRAHGQRFGHIQPANTLIRVDLVGDGYLVEMEAEAEL